MSEKSVQDDKDAAKMQITDALGRLSIDEGLEYLSYLIEVINKHQREYPQRQK